MAKTMYTARKKEERFDDKTKIIGEKKNTFDLSFEKWCALRGCQLGGGG